MSQEALSIGGVRMPRMLYGTAWKEQATQTLVEQALRHGFRGIDTANQRRHYDEAAVGRAIVAAMARGQLSRDELFLQTKFTFRAGQDHRLPYDPAAPIGLQVEQSLASSLVHLDVEVVDSYLLHGPSRSSGLSPADWEAWRAMETACDRGQARLLGVSNVSLEQLDALWQQARVPPRVVQNRCFAVTGWDRPVRAFCAQNAIVYQGFSLLTANRQVLAHPEVAQIAARHDRSAAQIVFRFALDVGIVPLTGTTSARHMLEDLAVFDFRLATDEVSRIEMLVAR